MPPTTSLRTPAEADEFAVRVARDLAGEQRPGLYSITESNFEAHSSSSYHDLGYRLIEVPTDPLTDRGAVVHQTVEQLPR
ncbi:hypothetical protein [Saccharothrix variisporea]|uniref:hypothetical protein n=1 Tax=Saccharothrix variisporea TaxID=543527 RepID=UPI000EB04A57|nr:hypothetical protein [Saccharothrix variisporea]